jgi:hypothetical protein
MPDVTIVTTNIVDNPSTCRQYGMPLLTICHARHRAIATSIAHLRRTSMSNASKQGLDATRTEASDARYRCELRHNLLATWSTSTCGW